jgi:CBS domain-containing protein
VKRVNIEDAFVGEPSPSQAGVEAQDSDEAIVLAVRGGEVVVVVAAGTPDEGAVGAAVLIRGALRLENERVLTFEIHEGASGAFFEDESAQLHRRRQGSGAEGLSAIGGSDYMADQRTAGEIMTRDVVTARRDLPTEELAALLAFHNVSGMPVLDDAGTVIGIVSEADVIGKRGSTVGEKSGGRLVRVRVPSSGEPTDAALDRRQQVGRQDARSLDGDRERLSEQPHEPRVRSHRLQPAQGLWRGVIGPRIRERAPIAGQHRLIAAAVVRHHRRLPVRTIQRRAERVRQ